MKRILRLFLVPGVIFAFTTASFAQATPATPATPGSPEPAKQAEPKAETKTERKQRVKTTRLEGEIVAVDQKAGTLTVKTRNNEQSFTVEGKVAKARLGNAKVGQDVRVLYYDKDGKLIATSLRGGLGGHESSKQK